MIHLAQMIYVARRSRPRSRHSTKKFAERLAFECVWVAQRFSAAMEPYLCQGFGP